MADDGMTEMKERAQDAQRQVKQTAQTRIREQVDTRSTQAGEQVSATAHALRSTGQSLKDEGQDAPARAAEQLAGYAERVGDYLTETDGQQLLHDAEDFGRRQPLAAIGVGLVLGIAASRLLKASSRGRYESRQSGAPAQARREIAPLTPSPTPASTPSTGYDGPAPGEGIATPPVGAIPATP